MLFLLLYLLIYFFFVVFIMLLFITKLYFFISDYKTDSFLSRWYVQVKMKKKRKEQTNLANKCFAKVYVAIWESNWIENCRRQKVATITQKIWTETEKSVRMDEEKNNIQNNNFDPNCKSFSQFRSFQRFSDTEPKREWVIGKI